MPETKCEYPCSLDLWAEVVKAKYIALGVTVFDSTFCIPYSEVGGLIEDIEYIQARTITAEETFLINKVSLHIVFEVILLVIVNNEPQVITINSEYNQDVPLSDFNPPINPNDLREEISDSRIIIKNWCFDWSILGRCDDPTSPCFQTLTTPITGTCLSLRVLVDIIDKLVKPHDVIVYAEYDPDDGKPC